MSRYIEGIDRSQSTLFPDQLEDWIDEDNPVRVPCALAISIRNLILMPPKALIFVNRALPRNQQEM